MAKKKQTPNQILWDEEYRKLKRRITDWKRKYHAVIDLPQKPERITKKDIQRLQEMKWNKLDEPIKKQARKEYEYQYENKMPEVYQPKPEYNPPSEQEWIDNTDILEDEIDYYEQTDQYYEEDEEGYKEVVVSRDEIERWIQNNIDTITVDRELDGVRNTLENLVMEAADAYGNYEAYLTYLENNADKLVSLATKAMYGYIGYRGKLYQEDPEALSKFATVLNLDRPLTVSQSERLSEEGWVSYDFNDL